MKKFSAEKSDEQNKESKKSAKMLLYNCITLAVCLVVLLLSTITYTWFADNRNSLVGGTQISIDGAKVIYVTQADAFASADNDINTGNSLVAFASIIPEPVVSGSIAPSVSMISPGSCGTVEFNLTCSNTSIAHVSFAICEYEGGVATALPDADDRFDDYVSTHLAVFTAKNGDAYEGWVNPSLGTDIALTDDHASVVMYWYWISSYEETQNTAVIADNDLRTHMTNNPELWLNYAVAPINSEQYTDAYDNADTIIGIDLNLADICLKLTISA